MLFNYETTEDAVHVVFDMACEHVIPDVRLILRFFDDDWNLCDLNHMPPWNEFAMHIRYGALTACILTTLSTNGFRVRWDIESVGGSVLRLETDLSKDEAEQDLYDRLAKRLEQAAVMTVNEA